MAMVIIGASLPHYTLACKKETTTLDEFMIFKAMLPFNALSPFVLVATIMKAIF